MENNKTLGTVSHAQSALTAAMINSVKTSMAKGICYVAAFDTACAEHAEAIGRVCSGGKRATARMLSIVSDVHSATTEAR